MPRKPRVTVYEMTCLYCGYSWTDEERPDEEVYECDGCGHITAHLLTEKTVKIEEPEE